MGVDKIAFGSLKTTVLLDDEGSSLTVAENYLAKSVTKPIRKLYEIRHKLPIGDTESVHKITDALLADESKLDSGIRIEHSPTAEQSHSFYVVEFYTILEY